MKIKLISLGLFVFMASVSMAQKTMMQIRLADPSIQPNQEAGMLILDASQVTGITFNIALKSEDLDSVDLGLPSGIKWATVNFGASENTPAGELYTASGIVGARPTLDDNEDIVNLTWGIPHNEDWRMPTSEEFQELIDKCTWKREGNLFRVTGPNNKYIYLPATSVWKDGKYLESAAGYYWTSDVVEGINDAKYVYFDASGAKATSKKVGNMERGWGMAIRAVCGKSSIVRVLQPQVVDLGLSVKWSSFNLGANKQYEDGGLYGWGDATGEEREFNAAKYGTYSKEDSTRYELIYRRNLQNWQYGYYCSDLDEWIEPEKVLGDASSGYYFWYHSNHTYVLYGENISGRDSFDVARAKLGAKWRMPTRAEIKELEKCTWVADAEHGGYRVYGIGNFSSNYIHVPLTGYRQGEAMKEQNVRALWWSSENTSSGTAYYYQVGQSILEYDGNRAYGFTVRPVADKGTPDTPSGELSQQTKPGSEGDTRTGIIPMDGVDLGLPSGVKWASWNLGAMQKTGDVGRYFAWGEVAWKNSYDSYDYYVDGYTGVARKSLDTEHDAAAQLWGEEWRMPTIDDLAELREYTSLQWESENNVWGYRLTSTIPGYTSKSIFLPAAGMMDGSLKNYISSGYYWLSSYYSHSNVEKAQTWASYINFDASEYPTNLGTSRYQGLTIRPVKKP